MSCALKPFSTTAVACAGLVFAGDDALRAAGNDSGLQVAAEAASLFEPELSIFSCRPCKSSLHHGEETSVRLYVPTRLVWITSLSPMFLVFPRMMTD